VKRVEKTQRKENISNDTDDFVSTPKAKIAKGSFRTGRWTKSKQIWMLIFVYLINWLFWE